MAASMVDQQSGQQTALQCETDGNFAVICSFFHKFSQSLGITYNIQHLKTMIEDTEHLNEELVELHIKLLRKRRKYINKDRWERALVKFCAEYSNVDSWELERYGYKNSKLSIKLEILKRLLEAQFDCNSKFKLEVNANDSTSLRILPIGRDVNGHMYWYQLDPEFNFRIYREEADDEQSWRLVCQNKSQLEGLITDLEKNNTIDKDKEEISSEDTNDTNEDINSNLANGIKTEAKDEPTDDVPEDDKMDVISDVKCEDSASDAVVKKEVTDDVPEDATNDNECKEGVKSEATTHVMKGDDSCGKCKVKESESDAKSDKPFDTITEDKLVIKEETESPLDSELIKVFDSKTGESSQVTDCDLKSSVDPKPESNEKSIFDVKPIPLRVEVSNQIIDSQFESKSLPKSEDAMDTDFDNKDKQIGNLFLTTDSQLECDVKDVIEAIVDRVCVQCSARSPTPKASTGPTGAVLTDNTLLSIEQTVSALCDFLVDEICKETDECETMAGRGSRGRGRPPRARGRGRGRGRGRATASVAKVNIYNKNTRSRSVSLDASEEAEEPVVELPQKRCSRRIQALQEKKAQEMSEQVKQEQQKIEQLAKKRCALLSAKGKPQTDDELSNGSRKRGKNQLIESDYEEESNSSDEDSKSKKKKKRRRRKGGPNSKPWEESDSSNSESEEEEEEEQEDEEEDVLKFTSDEDEFACEEPDSDAEPVVVRRARTVRKVRSDSSDSNESSSESEVENDDKPCGRCGKYDHPEWILLCDKCDDGFHTACLRPSLMIIPDGDWFCPPCEHKMLCEKLNEELKTLAVQLAKKEREELRKQRLKFVDISVANILKKPNERTGRRKGSDDKSIDANDDIITDIINESADNGLINENEENFDVNKQSKNKSKSKNKRKSDDNEEGEDGDEVDDEEESVADDEVGKALWSDEDEESEDEDKYVAIKSRRNRKRKNVNYNFTEFDQLIKSAIEEEMVVDYQYDPSATNGEPLKAESKGKDMSNIFSNIGEELDFSLTPTVKTDETNHELKSNELTTDLPSVKPEEKTEVEPKPTKDDNNKSEVKENEEVDDEEEEGDDDDEDYEDEAKSKSKSGKKRPNRRSSASARKRHRGLNDLSDTEEDEDSDDDYKGDSSATELEDQSDEEFVDDDSTQEDEEVSDDSDYKRNRRRSGRSSGKSKNSRSKGAKGGRKGYRKDAFVVSSDDSDEYRPGGSARKTRATTRKRVSYREETTTEEESEDDYYWNSGKNKKNKKKGRDGSESSDDDWGGRKASKDKKASSKKEWSEEEDDEEEDEEEEDNDDDKDESEESDGHQECPKAKPGPKSSKPDANARALTMKGKPRLSKARGLLNLKEDSDDNESEPKTGLKKVNKSKKSHVLSDSGDEESQIKDSKDKKSAVNVQTGAKSVDTTGKESTVHQMSDKNFETSLKSNSIESLEKMVSNSGPNCEPSVALKLSKTADNHNHLTTDPKTTVPPVPHLVPSAGQPINIYPSLKTSVESMNSTNTLTNSKLQNALNSRDSGFDKNPNQALNQNNNIDQYYSLTPLDSYGSGPPPLKPTVVSDPYVQQSSPPRILTLESTPSTTYPRHPHMDYTTAHPMSGPPKALIDPRMERPFLPTGHPVPPNVASMAPFGAHQPNMRPDMRQPHAGPIQGFGGPMARGPYYPSVPPTGHPYYARPHEPVPFGGAPHLRPQTNSPIAGQPPPRTTAPTSSAPMPGPPHQSPNYRPGPHWNQPMPGNRSALPGYPPRFPATHPPHPSAPGYFPGQQPMAGHPPPSHARPPNLPPNPYPGAHYPQNYGYFGPNSLPPGASPNGAFMIQNLLQHRPPAPEDSAHPPPVSTAASAPTTTATGAVTAAKT